MNLLSALQQAPMAIAVVRGSSFIVEMANENYLQTVDRTWENVKGHGLFEVLPELKEPLEPLLNEVMNTGIPCQGTEFPIEIKRFGKTERCYFNFVYQPLKGPEGSITGIMIMGTEVTDLVTAKHSLTESGSQLQTMVLRSPIAMSIFRGPDHLVEMANTAMFEKIWRKKPEEVLGRKILDVFPELNDQKYPQLLREVYLTGRPHWETESLALVRGNDGQQIFYLDYEYAPLTDGEGKVSGIMVTVNDVSQKVTARQEIEQAQQTTRAFADKLEEMVNSRTKELAIANEQLQRANQELLRSNSDLEKFAYAASHDMKEPMRKIQFFIDLFRRTIEERLETREANYLKKIEESAGRMSTLIADLLSYAQTGAHQDDFSDVSLDEIIKQVLIDLELPIEESAATIIVDPLPVIHGHATQIRQVLQNLVSNAVKFRNTEVRPEIKISAAMIPASELKDIPPYMSSESLYHRITIADNGIGFEPHQNSKIFEVFTRLNNRSNYAGTGIGLSIVRKVMDNHNGLVTASGMKGEGAVFTLYFPSKM